MAEDSGECWFQVWAIGEEANRILSLPENMHKVPMNIDAFGNVGFDFSSAAIKWDSEASDSILTFGRDPDCHVRLDGESYSERHCNFFLHRETKLLMLEDTSSDGDTELKPLDPSLKDPKYQMPFFVPRQRVLIEESAYSLKLLNALFFISFWQPLEETPDPWWQRYLLIKDVFLSTRRTRLSRQRTVNPRLSVENRYLPQPTGSRRPITHDFHPQSVLGVGGQGSVEKQIDLTTGEVVAVKRLAFTTEGKKRRALKELENIHRLGHHVSFF